MKRQQFENCDYYKVLYGRSAERASLQNLFQNDGTSWYVGVWLKIGTLTKLGLFFPVVCFIPDVFDQTLVEQLHRYKGQLGRKLTIPQLIC